MFRSVVGHSEGMDTKKNIEEVIEQCNAQLNGQTPSAGLIFSSVRPDFDLMLDRLNQAFPDIPIAGCSAAGELSSSSMFKEDSICLILFISDRISMVSAMAANVSGDTEAAAQKAVDRALTQISDEPSLCLVFAKNLTACPVCTIDTLHEKLGSNCKIFGGFSATDISPQDTIYQFCDTRVETDAVSLLLFSGPVLTAVEICNSWTPVGKRSVVDGVNENHITRIGGKPAMQFYHDTFGPHPEPVLEMPLAVFNDEGHYYIRVANAFNEKDQSVSFDSMIPKGSVVQFTEATPQGILDDTAERISMLSQAVDWVPQAALIVSCAARKTILGLHAEKEAELIQSHLPDHTPFIGFYSYGEIASQTDTSPPGYHHCTMTALLIGEQDWNQEPTPPDQSLSNQTTDKDNALKVKLLERKLERAYQTQERFEYTKSLAGQMQKRMNAELVKAKNKIEQQHSILKESLTLAQQVQQRLLPQIEPHFPGFEIAGKSIYCDETGGDYFDFLVLPETKERLSVVVGDVAGHGIASALLMATARALLRMRVSNEGSPAQIVSDLNRFLSTDVQGTGQFMSLFYLVLDTLEKTMTWVRAGHDPALRYLPSTDQFEEMQGEGLVLGVIDDWHYQEYQTDMAEPGEIILIGTDGIWETRDEKKQFFGKDRFMDVIRKNYDKPAQAIVDACLASVADFRMTLPVHDDITLVVIKRLP